MKELYIESCLPEKKSDTNCSSALVIKYFCTHIINYHLKAKPRKIKNKETKGLCIVEVTNEAILYGLTMNKLLLNILNLDNT